MRCEIALQKQYDILAIASCNRVRNSESSKYFGLKSGILSSFVSFGNRKPLFSLKLWNPESVSILPS